MKYTILKVEVVEDTLIATTQYDFDTGDSVVIDVAFFQPQSLADIAQGLTNRAFSEKARSMSSDTIKALVPQILLNEPMDLGKDN